MFEIFSVNVWTAGPGLSNKLIKLQQNSEGEKKKQKINTGEAVSKRSRDK